jgi:ketosteroid isomerase-like protein
MTTASNIDVVRQDFDAVRARDLEQLLATYHPDIVIREAPSLPYGGVYRGYDGAAAHAAGFMQTWDQLQSAEQRSPDERLLDAGEHVVACWRLRATGAHGEQLEAPVISLFTMRDGKVAELQMFHFDTEATNRFLAKHAAAEGGTAGERAER